jgi:hypothetical protein
LRQFIKVALPQGVPKARDAIICDAGPTGFAISLGIGAHAPELIDFKDFAVQAHAFLPVENRAKRIKFDQKRDERKDR